MQIQLLKIGRSCYMKFTKLLYYHTAPAQHIHSCSSVHHTPTAASAAAPSWLQLAQASVLRYSPSLAVPINWSSKARI